MIVRMVRGTQGTPKIPRTESGMGREVLSPTHYYFIRQGVFG